MSTATGVLPAFLKGGRIRFHNARPPVFEQEFEHFLAAVAACATDGES